LEHLASASQDLVRELSRMSSRSSVTESSVPAPSSPPPPVPPLPPSSPTTTTTTTPTPTVTRKSRWNRVFRLKDASVEVDDDSTTVPPPPPSMSPPRQMSATANNVTNLILGLSPAPPPPDADSSWPRGRRRQRSEDTPDIPAAFVSSSKHREEWSRTTTPASDRWSDRNGSPTSTRSRPPIGPGSHSENWRNSSSSASSFAAASAYTRFSNGSMRSVSTVATSVSNSSWRTSKGKDSSEFPSTSAAPPPPPRPRRAPTNVKNMTGIPWELHELPRLCHPDPQGDNIFSRPPAPKTKRRPTEGLQTISERPRTALAPYQRQDASTSTTGLSPPNSPSAGRLPPQDSSDAPKKVNKGQINALAKMLSAALKSR